MTVQSCSNCLYFGQYARRDSCLRRPPQVVAPSYNDGWIYNDGWTTTFPEVSASNWCGEWTWAVDPDRRWCRNQIDPKMPDPPTLITDG